MREALYLGSTSLSLFFLSFVPPMSHHRSWGRCRRGAYSPPRAGTPDCWNRRASTDVSWQAARPRTRTEQPCPCILSLRGLSFPTHRQSTMFNPRRFALSTPAVRSRYKSNGLLDCCAWGGLGRRPPQYTVPRSDADRESQPQFVNTTTKGGSGWNMRKRPESGLRLNREDTVSAKNFPPIKD